MEWLTRFADPGLDWNYALVTLMVRFIGVFVVMLVMQVALQTAARVVGWIENRSGTRAAMPGRPVPAAVSLDLPQDPLADGATIAAIGLALALENSTAPLAAPGQQPSPWALAGRAEQMCHLARPRRQL